MCINLAKNLNYTCIVFVRRLCSIFNKKKTHLTLAYNTIQNMSGERQTLFSLKPTFILITGIKKAYEIPR